MLSEKLLSILCCPICRSEKTLTQQGDKLICDVCNISFPVIDEIPHLLKEEAAPLNVNLNEKEIKSE